MEMGKVISIHSSRGGTGKSLIAVNLAAIYASKGKSVSLLDLDFRAPSLSTVFNVGGYKFIEYWTNDFLNNRCPIEDVLIDLTEKYGTKGKFMVGLANPSLKAIREIMTKDRAWEMKALKKLLALKPTLLNNLKIDYVIYDTSPGIQYSSINAVVSSDISVVISTLDFLDVEGVRYMLSELYNAFEKRTLVLINKAFPEHFLWSKEKQNELLHQLKENLGHPIIGVIPCYCDVLQSTRASIFAFENPRHPFAQALYEIADKLESL